MRCFLSLKVSSIKFGNFVWRSDFFRFGSGNFFYRHIIIFNSQNFKISHLYNFFRKLIFVDWFLGLEISDFGI